MGSCMNTCSCAFKWLTIAGAVCTIGSAIFWLYATLQANNANEAVNTRWEAQECQDHLMANACKGKTWNFKGHELSCCKEPLDNRATAEKHNKEAVETWTAGSAGFTALVGLIWKASPAIRCASDENPTAKDQESGQDPEAPAEPKVSIQDNK